MARPACVCPDRHAPPGHDRRPSPHLSRGVGTTYRAADVSHLPVRALVPDGGHRHRRVWLPDPVRLDYGPPAVLILVASNRHTATNHPLAKQMTNEAVSDRLHHGIGFADQ